MLHVTTWWDFSLFFLVHCKPPSDPSGNACSCVAGIGAQACQNGLLKNGSALVAPCWLWGHNENHSAGLCFSGQKLCCHLGNFFVEPSLLCAWRNERPPYEGHGGQSLWLWLEKMSSSATHEVTRLPGWYPPSSRKFVVKNLMLLTRAKFYKHMFSDYLFICLLSPDGACWQAAAEF